MRETGRAEARRPRSDEFVDDVAFVLWALVQGRLLEGSWDLYQIFVVLVLLLYDCSERRSLIWLLKRKFLLRQRMVLERRRCVYFSLGAELSSTTDKSSYGVEPRHSSVYWHMASHHSQTCAFYSPALSPQSHPESPSRSCRLFSDNLSMD